MADIADIAAENDLLVVEDACHAIGGTITGRDGSETPVGSCEWSDAATFSFHPVKTIAMGEGGAVTTQNDAVAEKLRLLRNHGITRTPDAFIDRDAAFGADGSVNPWYYEMQVLGHNYRAPDINCALGLSQLKKLDRFAEIRRRLVAAYDERIPSLAPLVRPTNRVANQNPVRHLYVVLIDFESAGISRGKVMAALAERGVGTQVHYIPVPDLPYWRERAGNIHLPGARAYYESAMSLPLFVEMDERDVEHVLTSLSDVLGI